MFNVSDPSQKYEDEFELNQIKTGEKMEKTSISIDFERLESIELG